MSSRYLLLGLFVLGCDSATSPCVPPQIGTADGCTDPPTGPASVKANTVGYRPDRGKRATYAGGPAAGTTFRVRRVESEDEVFVGQSGPAVEALDSNEPQAHVVDFRDFSQPGEYYLDVEGVGTSKPFVIGEDVYTDAFRAVMLGMYGQRCGTAVSFEWQGSEFEHGACHLADEAKLGWHDAGDYGKYTNNGGFSLAVMLLAWEHFRDKLERVELPIPEQGGSTPDYLDECRFQLEWLLAMQDAETGGVHDRITTRSFDALSVSPTQSTAQRFMAPVSTMATADFAATAARAARVFEEFDPDIAARAREAAQKAWQFLVEHPETIPVVLMGYTGSYSSNDRDDRLWAAAEIWELTGDEAALAQFETAAATSGFAVQTNWDWADLQNLGTFTYLESTREGRDEALVSSLRDRVVATASIMSGLADRHAYGRSVGDVYYWGINGVVARTALNFVVAARITEDELDRARFLDAASYQVDHVLGRNYFGRSFVTGVGADPPHSPHHRPSVADGVTAPWPGLLVGGPSRNTENAVGSNGFATQWFDDEGDFTSNEVAINWNSALIYALAGLLP